MAPKASTSKPSVEKTGETPPTKQPLQRLFTSLCAQIDGGHFTNALKTCDKILRLQPGDADALQTKLFLLLQTEQYQAALSLMDHISGHAFERAYLLYRLQREQEAAEVLSTIRSEGEDKGVIHLKAQMSYRQGLYQTAFDLYNQLLDGSDPQSEEHSDILTNLQASQKQMDFINTDFLRALDALPASLTASIDSSPPPTQPSSSITTILTSSAVPSGDQLGNPANEVKKVRMKRVPAGVVPGVTPPPDPERWLKKSERSVISQGSKRKKGGAAGGGATQGSVESSAASNTPIAKNVSGKGKKKK